MHLYTVLQQDIGRKSVNLVGLATLGIREMDVAFIFDVHHGNYNPSCKAKTNMQEDSDSPMTRARAKQLERTLTSQIGIWSVYVRKVKKRVLVNLSRLVCQTLFFGLDFCHVEFFLTLEGCSSYKYSIRICNKGLLANI
jgi:hypothetical protein